MWEWCKVGGGGGGWEGGKGGKWMQIGELIG